MNAEAGDLLALEVSLLNAAAQAGDARTLRSALKRRAVKCEAISAVDVDDPNPSFATSRALVVRLEFDRRYFYFSLHEGKCRMCSAGDPPCKFIALDEQDGVPLKMIDPLRDPGPWKETITELTSILNDAERETKEAPPNPKPAGSWLTRLFGRS